MASPPVPPRPAPSAARPGESLDVVVVDDDPAWREASVAPFRQRGDRVRVFADGLEALASCIESPPDVILTDVQMPRMDGWQFLRMIRGRPKLSGTPVIFLTSLSGDGERLKGYRMGVDAYVPKPFNPEELVLRARKLVRGAQARHDESQSALRGELDHVAPSSVLSFLAIEQKTGVLLLVGSKVARVFMRSGRPVKVEVEGQRVQSSRGLLLELLDWNSGQFEFESTTVEVRDEINAEVSQLLLHHAQTTDERKR
jgi:CheY-like chemotaxis protein